MDKIQDARNDIFSAETILRQAREKLDNILQYESNSEFKSIKEMFEGYPEYTIKSIEYDGFDIRVIIETNQPTNTYGGWNTLPQLYKIGYHPIRFNLDIPNEIIMTITRNND